MKYNDLKWCIMIYNDICNARQKHCISELLRREYVLNGKKGSNWLSSKILSICGLLGLNLSVALFFKKQPKRWRSKSLQIITFFFDPTGAIIIQYIYWYTSQGQNDWWLKPSSYIGRPTSIALMAAVNTVGSQQKVSKGWTTRSGYKGHVSRRTYSHSWYVGTNQCII